MNAKELIHGLIPPLAVAAIHKMRRVPEVEAPFVEFSGDYPSFDAAVAETIGYDDKQMAQDALTRADAASQALTLNENIDTRFQQVHSALSYVRDRSDHPRLSVLDIGGGNGSYLEILRRLFGAELDWTVLETKSMVEACQKLPRNSKFISDWPTDTIFDVVLLSGTLHCLKDPYEMLKLASKQSKWMILTRLPVRNADTDRIMIQNVPPHLFKGSIPMYCFSEPKIKSAISKLGTIVLSWDVVADTRPWSTFGFESRGYLVQVR